MFFSIIVLDRKIKMSLSDTCLTQLCYHVSVQMKELLAVGLKPEQDL